MHFSILRRYNINVTHEIFPVNESGVWIKRLPKPACIRAQSWPDDSRPLVSISCITFNHEPFIRDCLDSFLTQETDFPVEVLIHDDASTDQTPSVIREYEARYPHIIKPIYQVQNQYSQGKKPNLDFNFPRAKGKYIATCEGDDYWTDPSKLQLQVDFLDNNPDFVMCFHDAKATDRTGNVLAESLLRADRKRDYSADDLKKAPWVPTPTRCFRNVVNAYPDEISKVLNGDAFFTAVLGYYGKGKYLGEIRPAVYRKHEAGIWSGLDADKRALESFNSRLYMYQYHTRTGGQEFALEFLFDVVFPYFMKLYPDRNPFQALLRHQKGIQDRQRREIREIRNSHAFRLGAALLWPLKRLRRVLDRFTAKG